MSVRGTPVSDPARPTTDSNAPGRRPALRRVGRLGGFAGIAQMRPLKIVLAIGAKADDYEKSVRLLVISRHGKSSSELDSVMI